MEYFETINALYRFDLYKGGNIHTRFSTYQMEQIKIILTNHTSYNGP